MKILKTEYKNIIKLYNAGQSCIKIAKLFNVSASAIQIILNKNGIKTRTPTERRTLKYTIDENFFNKIDTEEKAYFLGFLYADGCNVYTRKTFQVSIQERDKYLLEYFNQLLKSNRTLKFRPRKKDNHQNQFMLRVQNKQISIDLYRLGCIPNKSLILKFPTFDQVPENLMNHFIRGYFDGDGTIYENRNNNTYRFAICVSLDFGNSFARFIKNKFNLHVGIVHKKNNKIKEAVISGGRQVHIIFDWLYQNSTIFLKRKYDKWENLKKYLQSYQTPHSSHYIGVCKQNGKFIAYASKKKNKYIGTFNTEIEAAQAYNDFIIKNKWDRQLNPISNVEDPEISLPQI